MLSNRMSINCSILQMKAQLAQLKKDLDKKQKKLKVSFYF